MTNPINLQIKRADNTWAIIEAAPLLIEEGHDLVPTGTYQLYHGYPEFDSNLPDADALREQYVLSMNLMREENPGYLGELHFTGLGYFEWKYDGDDLKESEVIQIVDCIQEFAAGRVPVAASGIILQSPEPPSEVPLSFKYGKNQVISLIRIEELEGHFVVHINDEPTSRIELMEDDWEITGGDIYDRDLLAEVLRRIKANS